MRARAVGNVVVDAHGEGVGLLEHHADALAQQVHVHAAVNVLAVQRDAALDAAVGDEVVHAVERFQQRRFAAAGRPDERGDFAALNVEVDAVQGVECAVVEVQILDGNLYVRGRIIRMCGFVLDGFLHVDNHDAFPPILREIRLDRLFSPSTSSSSTTPVAYAWS